jgi:hypothetical protein
MFRHTIRRRSRHARTAAVLLALFASPVAWVAMATTDSGAQTPSDPLVTVEASATTDLDDGQQIGIVIRPRAGITVVDGNAYFCRDGESYTTPADVGPKCAGTNPLSPNATYSHVLHGFPDGTARGSMNVGIGSTTTADGTGTVECGPADPCRVVVTYTYAEAGRFDTGGPEASTVLTFRDETNATPGCAGAATGAVRSVGSERLSDAWKDWTIASCVGRGPGALAPTTSALSDERGGLEDFAAGGADLVYSAVGYPSAVAGPAERGYVATPLALNAVVLAVGGGHPTLTPDVWPRGVSQPFNDVKLTIAEVATLVGQSYFALDPQPIQARNPEFASLAPECCTLLGTVPLIPGAPDARALFGSTFFDALAPDAWKSAPQQGGAPRGVEADFSLATPPFEPGLVSRYTNIASLNRSVYGVGLRPATQRMGAYWVLTDYASAMRLGLTPAAIQFEQGGEFVAPTPQTIAAGAQGLTRQPDGTLAPDPANLPSGAYPLTMVEYALAPSEPLPAERCASAPLLASWLEFVTGDGQQALPEGFVPLTEGLAADAAEAVDKVAAVSAPGCAGAPPTTPITPGAVGTPTASAGTPGSGSGAGSGSGSGSSGRSSFSGDGVALASVVPATPESRDEAAEIAEEAEIEQPPFLGVRSFSEVVSPVALLSVVLLTSAAAFTTSGRPLPVAVAQAPRRIGRRLRLRRRRAPRPESPS